MEATTNLTVRQVLADVDVIVHHLADIAMENFSGFYGHGSTLDRQRAQRYFAACIKAIPACQCFVTTQGSEEEFHGSPISEVVSGYIIWTQWGGPNRIDGDVWELKQIAVKRSLQGQGIGHQLISESLAAVKKYVQGRKSWLRKVLVLTGAENGARRLYEETLSAQVVATIPGLFRGDEVVLAAEYEKPK